MIHYEQALGLYQVYASYLYLYLFQPENDCCGGMGGVVLSIGQKKEADLYSAFI